MRINLPGKVDGRTASELRYLSILQEMFWTEGKADEALKVMDLYNRVYNRWFIKNRMIEKYQDNPKYDQDLKEICEAL